MLTLRRTLSLTLSLTGSHQEPNTILSSDSACVAELYQLRSKSFGACCCSARLSSFACVFYGRPAASCLHSYLCSPNLSCAHAEFHSTNQIDHSRQRRQRDGVRQARRRRSLPTAATAGRSATSTTTTTAAARWPYRRREHERAEAGEIIRRRMRLQVAGRRLTERGSQASRAAASMATEQGQDKGATEQGSAGVASSGGRGNRAGQPRRGATEQGVSRARGIGQRLGSTKRGATRGRALKVSRDTHQGAVCSPRMTPANEPVKKENEGRAERPRRPGPRDQRSSTLVLTR